MTREAGVFADNRRAKFKELAATNGRVTEADVTAVYDALPPTSPEALIGSWKGHSFDTGHPAHQRLQGMKWAGKDFLSLDDVNPVMIYGEDGKRTPSAPMGKARVGRIHCIDESS